MDKIRIRTRGQRREISRAACNPVILGIAVLSLALSACEASRFIAAYDALAKASAAPPLADKPVADARTQPERDQVSPVLEDIPAAQRTITLLRGRNLAEVAKHLHFSALSYWLFTGNRH